MPGLAGMRRPEGAEGPHPRPLSWQPTKLRRMRGSFTTHPQHVGYHFSRFDFRQFHFSTIWPDPTFSAQKVGGQKQMRTTLESFLDAQLLFF